MKTFIFDLDGTMYRGKAPIQEGIDTIRLLQKHGIPYLFLTNNSMRSPEENARHMMDMGYPNIKAEDFFNSAMASVRYAASLHTDPETAPSAWYIGQNGMEDALLKAGFQITENNPEFVFIGLDKKADYAKYSKALSMLLGGSRLIGTNKDRILAKPDGFEVGNGSVVALFEYASGQKSPDIAKPAAPILDYALEKLGISREDAILVGDNLETDIALGYNNGVRTVFVESGVHTRNDIDRLKVVPDLVVENLSQVNWIGLANAQ